VKLLLDENLSPRLVSILAPHWPDSMHVEAAGLRRATDETIWRFAREKVLRSSRRTMISPAWRLCAARLDR